jgi:hypothetical protein
LLKKTWHKWFFFAAVLAATLFLLQGIFTFGIRHNLNLKFSYITTHKIDGELLVLGPCEPLWMVSPEVLTRKTGLSCYNLASSHSDFADNYLHLEKYLEKNAAPKYVLLYVTPESFDLRYNTFHSYRFAPCLNEPVMHETVKENDPFYARIGQIPFMRYGYYAHEVAFQALQGWKHYFTGKKAPYYADGFEPPAQILWDNHHENMKKLYPKGYSFEWDSLREKYFRKIIDLCQSKDVDMILYESPILKEISDFQVNRPLFLEKIKNIAGEYDLPYLLFDKLPWAADRKYFISPMVTSLEGSYLFSDTLGGLFREKIVK